MQALRADYQSSLSLDDDPAEISDIRKCSGHVPLPSQPDQPVLPADRKWTDCVLAEIVCEAAAAILQMI